MQHCSLQKMICPIFLDFSQKIGEVNLFRCKLVHLPPRKGKTCNASLTAYIVEAGLMLRVIWKELFMKIPGATTNCRFYAKYCKSIHHATAS